VSYQSVAQDVSVSKRVRIVRSCDTGAARCDTNQIMAST
jgi:hypothetical protein